MIIFQGYKKKIINQHKVDILNTISKKLTYKKNADTILWQIIYTGGAKAAELAVELLSNFWLYLDGRIYIVAMNQTNPSRTRGGGGRCTPLLTPCTLHFSAGPRRESLTDIGTEASTRQAPWLDGASRPDIPLPEPSPTETDHAPAVARRREKKKKKSLKNWSDRSRLVNCHQC
jgi:hypothetical protein